MGLAHLLTAFAYYVIGAILIYVAVKVWWTHPVNRAFLFGPYLTETGVRELLRLWPMTFMFGAFIASCAVDHNLDWLAMRGMADPRWVETAALVEAIISWGTALSLLLICLRAAWSRLWHR